MLNFNKDVLNAYVFHMDSKYIIENAVSVKKTMSKEITFFHRDYFEHQLNSILSADLDS